MSTRAYKTKQGLHCTDVTDNVISNCIQGHVEAMLTNLESNTIEGEKEAQIWLQLRSLQKIKLLCLHASFSLLLSLPLSLFFGVYTASEKLAPISVDETEKFVLCSPCFFFFIHYFFSFSVVLEVCVLFPVISFCVLLPISEGNSPTIKGKAERNGPKYRKVEDL